MPISVTCPCGAKLEIDEKFLGKAIACPDCQKPLPTTAPAAPPPLDLPDNRRTSGLAVLSLTLSLVTWAIGGGIAGIVVGIFALKEIAARPGKLEGSGLARAGIVTGALGTFLLLAIMISPGGWWVLGMDQYLRDLAMSGRLNYAVKDPIVEEHNHGDIKIKLPSSDWAKYLSSALQTRNVITDVLILVNTRDDAFIAVQSLSVEVVDDEAAREKKVLERLYKSELLNLVGRLRGEPPQEGTIVDKKVAGGKVEITLDMRLARQDRRLLLQYKAGDNATIHLVVGCARKSRFERVQDEFRKAFDKFEVK